MLQNRSSLSGFTPDDWRVFTSKLIDSLPGKNAGLRMKWLQDKTGVSPSTAQNWISERTEKQGLLPDIDKLFKIAELLDMDLSSLIITIQRRLDPPPIKVSAVEGSHIIALAAIQQDEMAQVAKSLRGVTKGDVIQAVTNLGLMISHF